jgi:tRNA pseudouridine32 synthase/23S rRNA pseudouridine746 synthase
VHLRAIGHPIVGDPLYGEQAAGGSERLHLHACVLQLHHPLTCRTMLLEAPVPFQLSCR